MFNAETITVFLMDGDANGRIKASIENWTGLGYKIPRDKLDECSTIDALNQSSVYFLFGSSQNSKNPVYIGQAVSRKNGKGILARLKEHAVNPDKDYWTDAIVFTTNNNSFGPTEVSFLENLFYNMAIDANRFDVKNGNDPNSGHITEEKESSLRKYAYYAKLILGVFGYKIFTPLSEYETKLPANIKNKVALSKPSLDSLDGNILISGGVKSSSYLRQCLISAGYIDEHWKFTIAKLNKNGKTYWANPSIEFLEHNWLLVLNDVSSRKLHLFKIPSESISRTAVKTRIHQSRELIDLEMVFKDDIFVCSASKIVYQKWFIETVKY